MNEGKCLEKSGLGEKCDTMTLESCLRPFSCLNSKCERYCGEDKHCPEVSEKTVKCTPLNDESSRSICVYTDVAKPDKPDKPDTPTPANVDPPPKTEAKTTIETGHYLIGAGVFLVIVAIVVGVFFWIKHRRTRASGDAHMHRPEYGTAPMQMTAPVAAEQPGERSAYGTPTASEEPPPYTPTEQSEAYAASGRNANGGKG